VGNGGSEQEGGKKVKKRSPQNGNLWGKNAGGDYGGDAVGGIVKAIQKIERQRDGDCDEEKYESCVHSMNSLNMGTTAHYH
jgi:hypothetical protein